MTNERACRILRLFDRPLLRDLFWFWVLPARLALWLERRGDE